MALAPPDDTASAEHPDSPGSPDAGADAEADAGADAPGRKTRAPDNFASSREAPVTDILRRAGQVAWALVGLAIAIAIVGWVFAQVAVVFPPLVLAGMIVFLLNPFVTMLSRRGVPRAAGAAMAYLLFFAFVTLLVLLAIPTVRAQAEEFADHWPEVQANIEHWIDARAADLEGTPLDFDREEVIDSVTQDVDFDVGEAVGRATEIGFQLLEILLIFVLAPILAFYILVDLPHIRRVAEGLVPDGASQDVMLVARRINHAVGGFFRGQLVVAFIVGLMSSVGLWMIDLPFWLIIGMIAGFFNLIPLIGPWVGGIPAVLIALTTRDPITAVWAALVLLVVQQIDNHFISPLVMRRAVKLHPAVVMVVLLLGGSLFGFFGLLVAVPATAMVKIVLGHLWRVRVLGQTPEEWYEESEATDEIPGVGPVERVPVDDEAVERRRRLRMRRPSPKG